MTIKGEKLNSINIRIKTDGEVKYDISANTNYAGLEVTSMDEGQVRDKENGNQVAVFSSNGSMSITFDNVSDGVTMVDILNKVNTFIETVKKTDPTTFITGLTSESTI